MSHFNSRQYNGKRVVKLIGFSCLALVWVMNAAAAPGPGSQAAPAQAAPAQPASQLEAQDTGGPLTLAYSWTKNWGHASGEASTASMAVDRWGNLYMAGQFSGTVNFDPAGVNPGATFSSHNGTVDAYLLKLDANGRYQWAKSWGAGYTDTFCPFTHWGCGRDAANGVAVDAWGNAYVAGLFQDTVDFGNGHVAVSNAPNGKNNVFFTKFAADGANLWLRAWGGTAGSEAYSVALDSARGYVYVEGDWSTWPLTGTVDFNPGGPDGERANHGAGPGDGVGYDAFLAKYDLDGNFQWVRAWGGNRYDDGPGVAVDEATGNVYVCGMYGSQDINFDPAENPASNGAQHPASDDSSMLLDVFLTKFDADGAWQWVRTWGGQGYEDSGAMAAVDRAGNVYAMARFGCQGCNFNVDANGPATPVMTRTASGRFDETISKFDANGNYLWSQAWGGPLIDMPTGLAIDEAGHVYVANLADAATGGPLQKVITSTAGVTKFAPDGSLQWSKRWGGTGADSAGSPVLDGAGNLYLAGQFQHTIDFNPDSGVDHVSARGRLDAYVTRYLAQTPVTALAGGVVTVATGLTTTMAFPAAVAPITITVSLTSTRPVSGDLMALGPAIMVSAADVNGAAVTDLASPFTVTVRYTPSDAVRFNASRLLVCYWDAQAGTWKAIDTAVNTNTHALTARVSRVGMLAVLGAKGPQVFVPLIQR